MKRNAKRLLALLLVLTLCMGLFPGVAFAEGKEPTEDPAPVGDGVLDVPVDGDEGDGGPSGTPAPTEGPEDPAQPEVGEDEPLQPAEPAAPPEGEPEDAPDALHALNLPAGTKLGSVYCNNNALTSLDVSGCTGLVILHCENNVLTELNLGEQAKLKHMYCNANSLERLDLVGCPLLLTLVASGTVTTANGVVTYRGNEVLCVDESAILVTDHDGIPIDEAHFPDPLFRSWVADHCDPNHNGWLTDAEREAVETIECFMLHDLESLEGLAYFPNLKSLSCVFCSLQALDLSGNTALESLTIRSGNLTELDVSMLPALRELTCESALEVLILGNKPVLETIDVRDNHLTELDVSTAPALRTLYCFRNALTSLELGTNTILNNLFCYGNALTEVDLTGCPQLIAVVEQGTKTADDTRVVYTLGEDWTSDTVAVDPTVTLIGVLAPPVITSQPESVTAKIGETVGFCVTAEGDELQYQWQISTDGGETWADLSEEGSGYNSAALNLTVTPDLGGALLRCVVSNAHGVSVTSEAAPLTINGGVCGDSAYWFIENDTLTIYGSGAMWDYEDDMSVPWCMQRYDIKDIAIAEGISGIGDRAFYGCSNVKNLAIPEGVTQIGSAAFLGCHLLSAVALPETLVTIEDSAFQACFDLESITIPAAVSEIGNNAFYLNSLQEITFIGDAPAFGETAFRGNTTTAYYPAEDETWTEDVRQNYGGTITWVPYSTKDLSAEVYAGSLSLKGDIGVNLYVYLSDDLAAAEGAYVTLNDLTIPLADAQTQTYGGRILATFTLPVPAKEMTDDVVLRIFDSEGSPVRLTLHEEDLTETGFVTSVAALIERQLQTATGNLKTLLQAMSDYGSCAQAQFHYNEESRPALYGDLSTVTVEMLAPYAPTKTLVTGQGVDYAGGTLKTDSETIIMHYLKLTGSLTDYEIKVDGAAVTPRAYGSYWIVEIPNVAAKDLDTMYTLTVTKNGAELLRVEYSALSYAYGALTGATQADTLKELARAMYLYNQAANAYFGA